MTWTAKSTIRKLRFNPVVHVIPKLNSADSSAKGNLGEVLLGPPREVWVSLPSHCLLGLRLGLFLAVHRWVAALSGGGVLSLEKDTESPYPQAHFHRILSRIGGRIRRFYPRIGQLYHRFYNSLPTAPIKHVEYFERSGVDRWESANYWSRPTANWPSGYGP